MHVTMQKNKHFIQTLYVEMNTLAKLYDKKRSLHVETYDCMFKYI